MGPVVMVVILSAPPLSPADAARVLLTCRCESNRTDIVSVPEPQPSVVVRSSTTAGPYGELRSTPMPVSYRGPFVHVGTPEIIVRKGGR
jgi:hypothetical protein